LGNEIFARPEPLESFQLAAAEHDNGWKEWELQPRIDPVSFLPYSFMSLPTREHIALYQRGIERVVKVDRYAGLLVSMHCAGLYDKTRATIPGYSAKYVKAHEAPVVTDFLQILRLQQLRLKVDLRGDPATINVADEKWLQVNALRLEALDRLSLYFCLGPLEGATIDAVPADYQGNEVDWDLQTTSGNAGKGASLVSASTVSRCLCSQPGPCVGFSMIRARFLIYSSGDVRGMAARPRAAPTCRNGSVVSAPGFAMPQKVGHF
jgi:hypothetical protein